VFGPWRCAVTKAQLKSGADPMAASDNRIAFLDQAAFLRLRATGRASICQCTWIYDRAINADGLRRFHDNLGRGLLGRRIQRSPLPFGRHRWVACERSLDIDIATSPRPRADVGAWIDERAQVPVDPEFGPGWHLGILELDDGGTAVSVVASHCLVDGLGLSIAIAEAAKAEAGRFCYPPRSRIWVNALLMDGREFLRGLPQIIGALVSSIVMLPRVVFRIDRPIAPPSAFTVAPDTDELVVPPAVSIHIDLNVWNARRRELAGSSNSLFVAFGARLAHRMRRVHPDDGSVTITLPVSERAPDDTRANALNSITFSVDPTRVPDDLQAIRDKVKHGLTRLQKTRNLVRMSLPLIPLVPKWLARNLEGVVMGNSSLPVGCSNLGDLEPIIARVDGTDADYVSLRLSDQGVTKRSIERAHGQLFLGSGRINDKLFITVAAYQPGAENSKDSLQQLILQTLADMRLPATVDLTSVAS
jgi:diacylglycerol O-acyltransferase / wax synthase